MTNLRAALEIFAADESWLRNGTCDPNGSNFQGQQIAIDALEIARLTAVLPPKGDPSQECVVVLEDCFSLLDAIDHLLSVHMEDHRK